MKKLDEKIVSSATDLATYMGCRHAVSLSKRSLLGEIEKPFYENALLEKLKERGETHEKAYLEHLQSQGRQGITLSGQNTADVVSAMGEGADFIYQAYLGGEGWRGFADFLIKVDRPGRFGNWSYEVLDAKLAKETRGETILQLCVYSELLENLQGCRPEYAHVLTPADLEPERYRLAEYSAYYRVVKANYERFIKHAENAGTIADPCDKCDRCDWRANCEKEWRDTDHLTFVAGIHKTQRYELAEHAITTLKQFAELPDPLFKPDRGSVESLTRARDQARIQFEARETGERRYEVLPLEEGQGLFLLPEPSKGDVFFDIEGARFVGDQGFEYLLGFAVADDAGNLQFESLIANSPSDEHKIFDQFMQRMASIQKDHPDMHIYHFHSYEPSALKRLAGRYAMHEDLLDDMLRHQRFVDLHRVVKHTVRASVERYSIKDLEPFFDFERAMDLRTAGDARADLETWLEFDNPLNEAPEEQVSIVVEYNKDDCLATHGLHQWMESIRAGFVEEGSDIPRPEVDPGISEDLSDHLRRIRQLGERLREGLPADPEDMSDQERAKWLLSHLVEFYRREDKSAYWEKFRLSDLDDTDRLSERSAIAGLAYAETLEQSRTGIPTERYSFPLQDLTIKKGDDLFVDSDTKLGSVVAIDHELMTVDIKKTGKTKELVPDSVFTWKLIRAKEPEEALLSLAERVLDGSEDELAMRHLQRALPSFTDGGSLTQSRADGMDEVSLARHAITRLDDAILPIQGPPGTGKTHTGADMILDAVQAGKRVGVTAQSHKVITNLLSKAAAFAQQRGIPIRIIRKPGSNESDADKQHDAIECVTDNGEVEAAVQAYANVVGGTAWLWSRPGMANSVDVLFIDEAGQFSLANTCAVAQAANSLVLLGDPQQLDQPLQGTHPPGVDASGLLHILGDAPTMPPERGLFLPDSYRMHPEVCRYISEMFYEDKLLSAEGRERQALLHDGFSERAGLWYLPVQHAGNQSSSTEEAQAVAALFNKLIGSGRWRDYEDNEHPLTESDVLVVTPYNAQLGEILKRDERINVGTVDKFQGQEAPVVIVSMATSTPEEAPRGMDFLYSLNRLNVAVSRAKCATFLVCSPALIQPECKKPEHMRLANGLARYVEIANRIEQ